MAARETGGERAGTRQQMRLNPPSGLTGNTQGVAVRVRRAPAIRTVPSH